ncbi:AraC family transcriptional activator FtrA [Herbihabitans rhizosphaerae]|uniref:AraC family transcriptional activator FtrA n=1 Tax=Herbihabitans rhizosphaerae TaxID=1872711 RepID=A0A4V2EUL7_9PSEU|nr:helix-turn-helix domain-containing protein [Herbihabitans rhizosphaerae]RZS45013.1 AraC family transcriptional activator FtrA [Herbihabitans rhizosphaerae]
MVGQRQISVSVLAYDGMSSFETGIVIEVFGLVWPELDVPSYRLTVCTERPEPVRVIGGATLSTPHGLDEFAAADTVIVPSIKDVHEEPSPELIAALRLAHQRGARMVSICSGAFALAAAGLLDGRTVTTHWRYADTLRLRFPTVKVDPNPLYVDDGDVFTSAGCAAGMDLCLHLVRKDFGAAAANAIARRLVVPPHRDGGQAQYIESPVGVESDDDRVAATMEWVLRNLTEEITVPVLAEMAAMSTRTYLRHFTRCTGTSPIRWLITQRVQASLPLLETTRTPVEKIASAVGFDSVVTFRHHFTKAMHTSPTAYRRTFHPVESARIS